ncbi:MAG: adenylate/guanylate cyclase domain-containing protein [bacterium]|nr:adenylate/guanylate cyclase domain-containing protein [bacterium]
MRDWNFAEDGPLYIRGEWEFYWRELLEPEDFAEPNARRAPRTAPRWIPTPGSWNGYNYDDQILGEEGFASFRLRILLPPQEQILTIHVDNQNTNFRAYANGQMIGEQGVVGVSAEQAVPRRDSVRKQLPATANELEIILQISNFHDRIGGFTGHFAIGPEDYLAHSPREREFFLCGGISIIGLYHLALFAFRRERRGKAALYFGLFCLTIAVRLLVTGERILVQEFPELPFWFYNRVEYLSFYAAVPLFALFQYSVFPAEFHRRVLIGILAVAGFFSGITLLTSARFYDAWTLVPYAIFTFALLIYAIYVLLRALWNGHADAGLFGLGFLVLAAGVINDILRILDYIQTPYVVPFAFFAFIFAQSAMLARGFAAAFHDVEDLSQTLEERNAELSRMNRSFERFVPGHFLELLNKDNIAQVELGDSTLRHMSVLFTDIRSFTAITESMSPEESFQFLNEYLNYMEPAIHSHGGFVDKFQGDAIMALFRGDDEISSADQALAAALEMRSRLDQYNAQRSERGLIPIDTGIGLNTGDMMLGTVGSRNRLDTTVIGNTVNMASRLETLTAVFSCPVLISDFTYKDLREPADFAMREIGAILVRGRREPVGVYEVLREDSGADARLKMETAGELLFAIAQFKARAFEKARTVFEEILTRNPEDRLAQFYQEQCRAFEAMPPPDNANWTGAIEMQVK